MSRNGLLTSRELGTIPGTSQQVRKDLVPQTAALRAAFAAVFGKPLNLTDSYRPYSAQERIFRQRFRTYPTGHSDRRVWNGQTWWRVPGVASCATPGSSNHGWGTAIDFASNVNRGGSAEQRWMAANAHHFGWVWPAWARNPRNAFYEPWHYEATPVPVSAYAGFLVSVGVTIPTPPTGPGTLPTPTPLDPLDDVLEDTMYERTLEAAYREHLGRNASPTELDPRILRVATDAKPLDRLRAEVDAIASSQEARRNSVSRIYAQHLGRRASATEADGQLNATGGDLARIEAGVKGSVEAANFAKLPAAERAKRTAAALAIR